MQLGETGAGKACMEAASGRVCSCTQAHSNTMPDTRGQKNQGHSSGHLGLEEE